MTRFVLRRSVRGLGVALLALSAVASACSGSDQQADAPEVTADASPAATAVAPTVDSVRGGAAAAMAAIETVHFSVERSGAEVSIDEAGLLVFSAAEGRFAAPHSADAVVTVTLGGSALEIGAVAIAGELWLTNPISGAWEDAAGTVDFDPSTIFDPDTGIAAILAEGFTEVTLVDDDPRRLHLAATVAAADVTTLTSGLVTEQATADVWIDPATMLVDEIRFDTPVAAGVATWSVLLSNYGAEVSIVQPDTGDGS